MNSTSPEPLIVTIRSSVTLTSTAPEPSTPEGREGNWLKTVPGKGWFCLLRLYGPEQSFFDGTWNPATSSRAPEPKDPAHNRHDVRLLATLTSAHKCRYGRLFVRFLRPFLGEDCIDAKRAPLAFEPVGLLQFCLLAESETGQ